MKKFDLIVLGSGPAGEKGAVKAAYFGRKVALIEENPRLGGNFALLSLLSLKTSSSTIGDFLKNYHKIKETVLTNQSKSIEENLLKHEVEIFSGKATFINANTVEIGSEKLCADYFLIASGSCYERSFSVEYDQEKVFDEHGLENIQTVGKEVAIYGSYPFCFELACVLISLGVKVFLISKKPISFVDEEIVENLFSQIRERSEIIHDEIQEIKVEKRVEINFPNRSIQVDQLIDLDKKKGNTQDLCAGLLKLAISKNGYIEIDSECRTSIPHIFAGGSVTGPLVQASHAMDQGRVSVAQMFQTLDFNKICTFSPFALFTKPEIGMVGFTEKELIDKKIPYICGRAYFSDIVKGKLEGLDNGFLKLVFDPVSLKVLGVHVFGKNASEIIHYGVTLLEEGMDLNDLTGQIFIYPSFHELYKYAAYDGLGNLSGHKIKKHTDS